MFLDRYFLVGSAGSIDLLRNVEVRDAVISRRESHHGSYAKCKLELMNKSGLFIIKRGQK